MVAMTSYLSEESDPRAGAVLAAMSTYQLTDSSGWNALDSLATHVVIDDVEVDPAGIIFDEADGFHGAVSIYLVLKYGSATDDGPETTEAFRGRFTGHMSADDTAAIDDVTVDTSSFFEGERA